MTSPADIPILITTPDGKLAPETEAWLRLHDNPVIHHALPRFESVKGFDRNRCVNIAAGRTGAMMMGLEMFPMADYFFFLDSDVKPPIGAIGTLHRHCLSAVGGWIPARFGGWIGGRGTDSGFELFQRPLPGLTPTHLLSLGCTLVHRDYLGEPFDPGIEGYVQMKDGRMCHLADSGAFSVKMAKAEVTLFLDGDVVASHHCQDLMVGEKHATNK